MGQKVDNLKNEDILCWARFQGNGNYNKTPRARTTRRSSIYQSKSSSVRRSISLQYFLIYVRIFTVQNQHCK